MRKVEKIFLSKWSSNFMHFQENMAHFFPLKGISILVYKFVSVKLAFNSVLTLKIFLIINRYYQLYPI